MADQNTIETLKNYIRKLRKIIIQEVEFSLFGRKLIKKTKIDDSLCCIIASLPKSYKKALADITSHLSSRIAYNHLNAGLKKKFILNSNLYIIDQKEVLECLNVFLANIERDINWAEAHDY